jgi:hypothetical protein
MKIENIAAEIYQKEQTEMFSENDIHEAIRQLRPGCSFDLTLKEGNYIFHTFLPKNLTPPTKEEIEQQLEYQEECRKYYQYAYDRCHEYPDGFEQFDMLWHAVNEGVDLKNSEWFQIIKEIKEKYPKPTTEPPTKKE